MAVVLRYVNKFGEVIERFLALVHVVETSSQCLKDAIDALFEKHGLSLSRLREWMGIFFLNEVDSFCVANNIEVINMEDIIKSRTRMRRDGQSVTNYHHYQIEIFCEVVDLISQELNSRFPEVSTDLLLSVACLDPRDSYSNFDVDKLVHLAKLYPEDFSWTELLNIRTQLEMYIYDVKKDREFLDIEDLGSLAKKWFQLGKLTLFHWCTA